MQWVGPTAWVVILLLPAISAALSFYSWQIPVLFEAEAALHDTRVRGIRRQTYAATHTVLVDLTDGASGGSLSRLSPSSIDANVLAVILERLNTLEPRAVFVNLPFDGRQQEIDAFFEPSERLLIALASMRSPTYMTWVGYRDGAPTNWIAQIDFLRGLRANDPFRASGAPKRVRYVTTPLEPDPDGVYRRWPQHNGHLSFGEEDIRSVVETISGPAPSGEILFTQRDAGRDAFDRIPYESLEALPGVPERVRSLVRGRYVFIGLDAPEIERVQTPFTADDRGTISLTELYAHSLEQALRGESAAPIPGWVRAAVGLLAFGAGAFASAVRTRRWLAIPLGLSIIGLLPYIVHVIRGHSLDFPAVGALLSFSLGVGSMMLIWANMTWARGNLARMALARYLPPEVAAEIMKRPDGLNLIGERRPIFILFSDLEGFTGLCHELEPHVAAELLNEYLEMLASIVLSHGGTIDKFVGDAVVAFWGAPFSKPDDADRVAAAALKMHKAGEDFRSAKARLGITVGRTRIGVHYGDAIVGNFGGADRIQYTALGDSMNVAARLEAANKELGTSILVSKTAAERVSALLFRSLGSILVRGRSAAVEIVEPVEGVEANDVQALNDLIRRAVSGDEGAAEELSRISGLRPSDAALAILVTRIKSAAPGTTVTLS
jgi:adenylate cyclase